MLQLGNVLNGLPPAGASGRLIQAVAAFADPQALHMVQTMLNVVLRLLEKSVPAGRTECDLRAWDFQELSFSETLEQAVCVGAKADLVICATDGNGLPPQVRTWIERWSVLNRGPTALVGLLRVREHDLTKRGAVERYLRAVAQAIDAAFFIKRVVPATNRSAKDRSSPWHLPHAWSSQQAQAAGEASRNGPF